MGGLRSRARLSCAALLAAVLVAAACSDSSNGGGAGSDAGGGGGDGNTSADSASGGVDGSTDGTTANDGAVDGANDAATDGDAASGPLVLTSTAFAEGAVIPAAQACNTNTSPPLAWSGSPAGTLSYAVVMRDLTLVGMPNYHWVIYDIPATETGLAQGVSAEATPPVPLGAKQTFWSFSANYSYLGPCPPVGNGFHNYQFTVYAFATATIPVPGGTTDPAIADAVIQANKTASASLTGKYQR